MQQLADWIERELKQNQNPLVKLDFSGGVVNIHGTTLVSPMGALVQMFKPIRLSEARAPLYGVCIAPYGLIVSRAAEILGISLDEYLKLLRYIYGNSTTSSHFEVIAKTIRTLK